MATLTASNATQLSSALSSASGGDTIILADGYYGDLTITNDFATEVTLQAENNLGSSLDKVKITGTNITLDGLTINGRFTIENADHVKVENSLGTSWNEVLSSTNVSIVNNEFTGTLNLEGVANFLVENNYIHEVNGGDLLRVIGDSYDGVIENNTLWDVLPIRFADGSTTHDDAIQMFSRPGGTPHDIVIRGNHIYDDPATGDSGNLWGQGIFLGGPTGGYRNITIEENIVDTQSPNAIYISVGIEGNVIKNNTVLGSGAITARSGDSSGTQIYDNVVKQVTAQDGATAFDNFFYSDASTIFQNGGDGSTWEGFLPIDGSPIDFGSGYGALERLAEMLTGEPFTPDPTSEPETEPDPQPEPAQELESDPTVDTETIVGSIFSLPGNHEIAGANDVLEFAHDPDLELANATVALTFNANTVSGSHGLLSKDATGYGPGGHFTSYIEDGKLTVRFQDGSSNKVFSASGIEANVDYDLQVSFGNGEVTAMLDGQVFGQASFDSSFATNTEVLQIGANGWASDAGESGFRDVFDGTISDVIIADSVVSYGEMESILAGDPSPSPEPEPSDTDIERVFAINGSHEISSASDVLEFLHEPQFLLSEGTIGLTFNADSVAGSHGLISKDATGYGPGGHFTSYIEDGKLTVRFQDGSSNKVFSASGIEANVDYDLQVSFGNGEVTAMLDGQVFGQASFDSSFATNTEVLQIGANGWASDAGESGFRDVFDGTISDVIIFDQDVTTYEVDYFLG